MSKDEENAQNMIEQYRIARRIIKIVQEYTGVYIHKCSRKREVSDARQIAIYLIKENTCLSYKQTAIACGLQLHASAWHACRQVKLHMSIDRAFKEKYGDLIDFT